MNTVESALGALPWNMMLVRSLQYANAKLPMLVTLAGIVTLIRPMQLKNASTPMLVTLLEIVMSVRKYWA